MAVNRRVNWLSQVRVDVPDMRSLESAVSNDFDQLIQSVITGTSQGYVVRGFELSMTGAVGGAASALQMIVDPGALIHIAASQSGTVYMVPSGTGVQQLNSATNTIVDGAFVPGTLNYVGIDYERFIDNTTSAQVYLWNPTTKNETTKNAPRAQILRYRIKISTSIPAANVLPICTVLTGPTNNVVTITDCRPRLGRLGQGGWSANPFHVYPWTAQSEGRTENPSASSSNSVNPFHGGDKMIGSLKEWMDAIMSSLLEVKGTTYWYSTPAAGSLQGIRQDLGNTVVTGNTTISHSVTSAGQINWGSNPTGTGQIYFKLVGSRLSYQIAENASGTSVTLTDNQVAYITLVRGVAITPNLIFTPNSGPNTTTVASVGGIAWTSGLLAGDWIRAAADTDASYYKIQSVDSLTQVTLSGQYTIANITAAGVQAVYAYGTYTLPGVTGTARDIVIAAREAVPTGQNVTWLFLRSDDSGALPRIYVKFMGQEIQQGERREISDTIVNYYDETIDIVASGQTPPTSLNGPIAAATNITLPNNSRASNTAFGYVVGSGILKVFLNGQYLRLGADWAEVGTTGTLSTQVQTLIGLVVGDTLEIRT